MLKIFVLNKNMRDSSKEKKRKIHRFIPIGTISAGA